MTALLPIPWRLLTAIELLWGGFVFLLVWLFAQAIQKFEKEKP